MPVGAPNDGSRHATFSSEVHITSITHIHISFLKTKDIATKIYISLKKLRIYNIQRSSAIKNVAVLSYGVRSDFGRCYHTQTPAGARTKCDLALK